VNLSERMKSLQASGHRVSWKPPYGWMVDPNDEHRLVRNMEEQAHIYEMQQLRASGKGFYAIATALKKAGILNRNGNRMDGRTIDRILKNNPA
jgi:hypothetical protein